jgi:hypothetical protein
MFRHLLIGIYPLSNQSVLPVLKRVEAKHHVMKPGNRGQDGRNPEHHVFGHGLRWRFRIEKGQKHRKELDKCGHLADQGGMNPNLDVHDVQDGNAHHDDNVPADDNHGQPARNVLLNAQRDKRCYQQEFVGNGVQVGPKFRPLVEDPGDEAIQSVADTGNRENENCHREHVPLQKNDKERRQQDPDNRNKVGNINRQSGISQFHVSMQMAEKITGDLFEQLTKRSFGPISPFSKGDFNIDNFLLLSVNQDDFHLVLGHFRYGYTKAVEWFQYQGIGQMLGPVWILDDQGGFVGFHFFYLDVLNP